MNLDIARALTKARSFGLCEGCGAFEPACEAHHRDARGMGGVFRAAQLHANDPRNLLALCGTCHRATEHADTWQECIGKGWRVPAGVDSWETPALLHTVNGYGWWLLTGDGGYVWQDLAVDFRLDC
jgi:hypothetical protein